MSSPVFAFLGARKFRARGILVALAMLGCSDSSNTEVASTQEEPADDAGISDASTRVTCGYVDTPCCESSSCGTGLVCEDGQCVLLGEGKFGESCAKPSDCASGICLELGNGASVCTETCAGETSCVDGWACEPLDGKTACQCQPAPETCNARDDDCNGIVDDAPDCKQACDLPDECEIATGIEIDDIVLFQAVGIPLVQDGEEVTSHPVPIITGKDALVRVHVRPQDEWRVREVVAWIELGDGVETRSFASEPVRVSGASVDEDLATTLNIEIPGAYITPTMTYRVTVREKSPYAGGYAGTANRAFWPAEGTALLESVSSRGNFKFTIVPYRHQGRLPDTSEAQLQRFVEKFTSYPTPGIEIEVHEPVDYDGRFEADGLGWNLVLNRTCSLRRTEGAASNHYYYGLIQPTGSLGEFCEQGCVLGLAYLGQDPTDDFTRCGIGLGYTGNRSVETALHELGHALGRPHAPCGGPDGVDANFPHPGGTIGIWGYEPPQKRIHPPSTRDFMGYCSPMWISDYTYRLLYERIAFVNAMPRIMSEDRLQSWRSFVLEIDGSLHLGETTKLGGVPRGVSTEVDLLDATGARVRTATGFLYESAHLGGGTLLVSERELKGAHALRLASGAEVRLN